MWGGKRNRVAQFPHQLKKSPLFGQVTRPIARVDIWSEGYSQWERVEMVVDSGADYTILPRYLAVLLDIDLQTQTKQVKTQGVGGKQVVYFLSSIEIKLGKRQLSIPVGFLDTNQVPPLLGRHQALDAFEVHLEGGKQTSFYHLV